MVLLILHRRNCFFFHIEMSSDAFTWFLHYGLSELRIMISDQLPFANLVVIYYSEYRFSFHHSTRHCWTVSNKEIKNHIIKPMYFVEFHWPVLSISSVKPENFVQNNVVSPSYSLQNFGLIAKKYFGKRDCLILPLRFDEFALMAVLGT